MALRILVAYYSRTGHTRRVAEQIADALGADLEPITEAGSRSGVIGFLRSALQAVRGKRPPIHPSVHSPPSYDLVVVGTPIWSTAVAAPVRSYLHRHRLKPRAAAFFCTSGTDRGVRAFSQMAREVGREPVAKLAIREAELERAGPAIGRFVAEVTRALLPAPETGAVSEQPPSTSAPLLPPEP
jgi:flavodoxin